MITTERKDAIRSNRAELESELRSRGCTIRGDATTCPAHDDEHPSASIKQGDGGAWRVFCHVPSCGFKGDVFDIRALAGGPSVADQLRDLGDKPKPPAPPPQAEEKSFADLAELQAAFPKAQEFNVYTDPATGRVGMVTIRLPSWDNKRDCLSKTFLQAHQRADGRYILKAPPKPWPIFNRTRIKDSSYVVLGEGEQCIRALAKLGIPATTSPGGAKNGKNADWSPLCGKKVFLWPDNDSAGRQYVQEVGEILSAINCELWLVDPEAAGLENDGDDVCDFLAKLTDQTDSQKWDAVDAVLRSAKRIGIGNDLDCYFAECAAGQHFDTPWPWSHLTRLTSAIMPGCVVLLCGDAGDGKSFFLLEAMLHWHRAGIPVALFELEEDRRYWLQRSLAILSGQPGVTSARWIHENAAESERIKNEHANILDSFARRIADAPTIPPTHADILGWIEKQATAGARIIAVDPITLAAGTDKPWIDDLQFMVKAKTLARQHGFSLILTTHPRITKKGGNVLDNLAGGAAYPRFAQCVLWLKRHKPPKEIRIATSAGMITTTCNRSMFVAKCRNGIGAGWNVAFDFHAATLRFAERGIEVESDDEAAV